MYFFFPPGCRVLQFSEKSHEPDSREPQRPSERWEPHSFDWFGHIRRSTHGKIHFYIYGDDVKYELIWVGWFRQPRGQEVKS